MPLSKGYFHPLGQKMLEYNKFYPKIHLNRIYVGYSRRLMISKTERQNIKNTCKKRPPPKIQIELEYISTHILIKIMSRQEDFDLNYNFFPEFAKNKISVYGHFE